MSITSILIFIEIISSMHTHYIFSFFVLNHRVRCTHSIITTQSDYFTYISIPFIRMSNKHTDKRIWYAFSLTYVTLDNNTNKHHIGKIDFSFTLGGCSFHAVINFWFVSSLAASSIWSRLFSWISLIRVRSWLAACLIVSYSWRYSVSVLSYCLWASVGFCLACDLILSCWFCQRDFN